MNSQDTLHTDELCGVFSGFFGEKVLPDIQSELDGQYLNVEYGQFVAIKFVFVIVFLYKVYVLLRCGEGIIIFMPIYVYLHREYAFICQVIYSIHTGNYNPGSFMCYFQSEYALYMSTHV